MGHGHLNDPEVQRLLAEPNYAVISTLNPDGVDPGTVVWIDSEDGALAVNSAVGRTWPTNLERDPRITVLVYRPRQPRTTSSRSAARRAGTTAGADAHIDRLAKKYLDLDEYPYRSPASSGSSS